MININNANDILDIEEMSPYDLGWVTGYNDELADCPYPDDSKEAEEYKEGYVQGCSDC